MTPIRAQSYRRYDGPRHAGRSWRVIARAGVRMWLSNRWFLAALIVSWLPFLIRVVQLYVAASVRQAAFLQPTTATFHEFLDQQVPFALFIALIVGGGSVAADRQTGVLAVYLSKPLPWAHYVIGKLLIVGVSVLLVTFVPAIMLLIVQVVFAGDLSFAMEHIALVPQIAIYAVVEAGFFSAMVLAVSSMTSSTRAGAATFAALVFAASALTSIVRQATDIDVSWASPLGSVDAIGNILFDADAPAAASLAALVVVGVVVLCVAILKVRIQPVEVVG